MTEDQVTEDHAVVLVGLGADGDRYHDDLTSVAGATGAQVAYLQVGSPNLVDVLDRLRDAGETRIELVGLALGAPTARSWLRRVAGHWVRCNPTVSVTVGDREVTGREAPLHSPAWEDVPAHTHHVFVCRGPRCSARGSADTAAALNEELRHRRLGDDDVLVTQTGCLFPCNQAPVVVVHPDDTWYGEVTVARVGDLVAGHLVDGRPSGATLPRSPRKG